MWVPLPSYSSLLRVVVFLSFGAALSSAFPIEWEQTDFSVVPEPNLTAARVNIGFPVTVGEAIQTWWEDDEAFGLDIPTVQLLFARNMPTVEVASDADIESIQRELDFEIALAVGGDPLAAPDERAAAMGVATGVAGLRGPSTAESFTFGQPTRYMIHRAVTF